MMFGLPSKESLRVAALVSSMKLHEISKLFIETLSLRNSASDSQNMWPREFEERLKLSRFEELLRRSIQSFDPALSSSLFNFSDKWFKILLTFKA